MGTHFIKAVKFNKDFRTYKAGELFEFKPGINLIVGDQGCGKSSFFYSVMNFKEAGISMAYDPDHGYLFLDTEKMNPRITDSFDDNRYPDAQEHYSAKVEHVFKKNFVYGDKSHGQVMLPLVQGMETEGKTLFIDEPEAGLSIRSQHKVWETFKKFSETNQLIIATHSLIFIQASEQVLSLEHKKWMSSAEFIETQKP